MISPRTSDDSSVPILMGVLESALKQKNHQLAFHSISHVERVNFTPAPTSSEAIANLFTWRLLASRPEWKEKDARDAYAEAAVEQGIAWQVRINRERRGLTQTEFAKAIGTKQSAISRMEDPAYGRYTIPQSV